MSDTQLVAPNQRKDIRDYIQSYASEFALALPKIVTPERFVRVALTCINKNPKLLQCTRDSMLACLLDCAQLGIEPDGRRAHLIPFEDRRNNRFICTLIIDYKGLADLVRRSGEVASLHADVVYEADEFDYSFGTGQFLRHKPSFKTPPKDGEEPIAAYSYVKLKDGQETFDVMPIAGVKKVRDKSQGYRSAVAYKRNDHPWMAHFDEMAKKTVFRRHSKWLPFSADLREKIEKDDEALTEEERFRAAKLLPMNGPRFGAPGFELPPELPPESPGSPGSPEGEPPPENEPEPTRRHRRTKAQMEAARAAEAGGEPEKPDAPPRATPLQGLRNLIASSPVKEEEFRLFLIRKMMMEPHQKLEDLNEHTISDIRENFLSFAGEILDNPMR